MSKREDFLAPAQRVLEDGIDFWASERPADGSNTYETGREQQYKQIRENRYQYTSQLDDPSSAFGERISKSVEESDLKTMSGALLYLAGAGYKARGVESTLIGDNHNQKAPEVAKFVLEFNRFSKLDKYTPSKIVNNLIDNEDDELYQLLSRELSATRTGVQDLNVPAIPLDDWETLFLQKKLNERQEKMSEAVREYVGERKLYQILRDFEQAVIETGEASEMRGDVADTIETELTELEEELKWVLKTQRELFVSEVESMTAELEEALLTSEEFTSELEEFEGELQWAFREHREFLLSRLQTETDKESLTAEEMVALLSEQRDDIVESLKEELADSQSQLDRQLEELRRQHRTLEKTILEVEESRESVGQEEIRSLIETELGQLTEQRDELETLIDRFERERERLAAEVESLEETPSPPELVGSEEDGIEGTDVIPAPVARLYEEDFLARLERSVRETEQIHMPKGEPIELEAGYWDHPSRSERGSYQGELLETLPEDASIREYPERRWVRFAAVESTGLLGGSEETHLVIEGCTTSRVRTYAEQGSDWTPATLSELHRVVGEVLDRSLIREQEEAEHLLVVGSPTGWRQRVTDEIESGSLFEDVSVCLVDLRKSKPFYYSHDPLLRDNQWLLSLDFLAEKGPEAADKIKQYYTEEQSCERVLLETVVTELGYDPHVVKRAFDILEERGEGTQIETDKGLLLSFEPV